MNAVKIILARLAEARRLPSVLASLASAREELDATRTAYRKALGERDDARQRADLAEHRAEATRVEFVDKLEKIRSVANAATRDDLLGPLAAVEALAERFQVVRWHLEELEKERDRERAERAAAERELGDARERLTDWEEARASEVAACTAKIDSLAAEIDRLHRVIGGGAAPLPRRDG